MRRKGGKEVPSADEVSDEGAEGRVFLRHFIGGVRRSWGAVRAFAVGEGTLRGDVGRGLRRFPRAILEVVTPGRFAARSR